ncbi:hypothetical protein I4U23_018981 [Adineta vaga]|nr:hypothetical protein I4U23_018981 [Adineta vaga]
MVNWIKCLYPRQSRFRRTIILPIIIFIITTLFLYVLVEYYTVITDHNDTSSSLPLVLKSNSSNLTCVLQKETYNSIRMAPSNYCKEKLRNLSCEIQTNPNFYPESLPRFCPIHDGHFGDIIGCVSFDDNSINQTKKKPFLETDIICIDYCLKRSLPFAEYNAITSQCICSLKFPDHDRVVIPDRKCPENTFNYDTFGKNVSTLYRTGFRHFGNRLEKHRRPENDTPTVIVFFLTVGGRKNLRQIHRLLRAIYLDQHYYLIHVDKRDDYLHYELGKLSLKYSNIRLTRKRYPTTWGSSTLLDAHLSAFKDIFEEFKWNFSFIINLSESDFPLKSIRVLTNVLSVYTPYNFLGPHGRQPFEPLIKSNVDLRDKKIVLMKINLEIIYDGGSDWYVLNREFVHYVTYGNDELINGIRHLSNYSLLSCEMFFHTVLTNSIYCDTYIRNNLRFVNWDRKRGCKCQHKNVVDWCGCSPVIFKMVDKLRFNQTITTPIFFARKFDPTIDETIIDWLDAKVTRQNISNGAAYLQNIYHSFDGIEKFSYRLELFDLFARSKLNEYQSNHFKLEQIHNVFRSSIFQGYSLQYKSSLGEQIELFVKLNSLVAKRSDAVKSFDVGLQIDIKEMVITERSRTFFEPEEIKVIIEWQTVRRNDTALLIKSPDDIVVYRLKLNSSKTLFVVDIAFAAISIPDMRGVWEISIVDINTEDVLALSDFLVLSSDNEPSATTKNLKVLDTFWSLSNMCSTMMNSSLSNNLLHETTPIIHDCFQQTWSVFFFDSKTNWE